MNIVSLSGANTKRVNVGAMFLDVNRWYISQKPAGRATMKSIYKLSIVQPIIKNT